MVTFFCFLPVLVRGLRRLRGNFPDDVATLWEGDGLGARASVASAAGAQEEPLLGGVAVPRDGHGSRRDAAAHVCVYLCAHMNVFSLSFPAQVPFTCSVLWFSHFQGLWPFCWCLLRVRLPILDSTVLEWLTLLSCCACAIIFPFVLSLGLFSLSE